MELNTVDVGASTLDVAQALAPVVQGEVRFAFHTLDTKLSDVDGMVLQTVQMAKESGIASKRVRVPLHTVVEVAAFCAADANSALATAVEDYVQSLQRAHVFKPALLNGMQSIGASSCTLAALNAALVAGGVSRLTKELLVSVYDGALSASLAALIAESKGLVDTCTQEEILALAGPSIKVFRALFLQLGVRDSVLDEKQAVQMKKVIAYALQAELITKDGMGATADTLTRAIDARVGEAIDF